MKVSRNLKTAVLVALAINLLIACTLTSKLYERQPYTEEVSSVLISNDNKSIIVLSDKYHYIFDAPPIILGSIQASFSNKVKIQFDDFQVDTQNNIVGSLFLTLDQPTLADKKKAYQLKYGNGISARVEVNGMRYAASDSIDLSKEYQLGTVHKVKVYAPQSVAGKAVRVLLSPITMAADGVLTIGKVALIPVMLALFVVVCSGESNCG